jgi:thiamine biosynthesis lipoprotein
MGCEFELILCGRDRCYLASAAEEAFEEVERLEEQMSVFIPTSEISCINAAASSQPVRIEPRLFDLLELAARLSAETEGAFDISAGRLVDLWSSSVEGIPSAGRIAEAVKTTGMSNVILDWEDFTVRFAVPGMKLDLGAVGKGFAVRRVVDFLVERGITSGLVSAGSSTVYALGSPPGDDAWTVGIRDPLRRDERLTSVRLRHQALSTSGSHERFVEIDGTQYSHIIDPRSGRPAEGLLSVSVITGDPAESDALSTGFFILGIEKTKAYCEAHEGVGAVLVAGTPDSGVEITEFDVK